MHLHMHKRKDIFPQVERTEKFETFDNLFSNEILDKLLLWDTNRHISQAICADFFKNKTFEDKLNVTVAITKFCMNKVQDLDAFGIFGVRRFISSLSWRICVLLRVKSPSTDENVSRGTTWDIRAVYKLQQHNFWLRVNAITIIIFDSILNQTFVSFKFS